MANDTKKILILGGGFGGVYALRKLARLSKRKKNLDITLVNNDNFFLFSPLLHEVAMGRIETRHITCPIRKLPNRDRFKFVQANIEKIDVHSRKVTTSAGILEFDSLVLALGGVSNTSGLDSRDNNIFTLKSLHDSVLLRNHIIGLFERASVEKSPEIRKKLLTFVVSGGGYTGVQVVTELHDFIFKNLLKYYKEISRDSVRIILVETEDELIKHAPAKIGSYITNYIGRLPIEVKLGSRVTQAGEEHIEINGVETIDTHTLIWVTGATPNPRVTEMDGEKDDIGRVLVNDYLEVSGVSNVFAIGDCAHFKNPKTGQPIPLRAHTTVRQAKVVAHNVLADVYGGNKKPYKYSQNEEVISLGTSGAIFRFHNLYFHGLPARLIWLAGYSLLFPGAYNQVRIISDWVLSGIFGRDTTFLKEYDKPL